MAETLSYVDFSPECLREGGLGSVPSYEPFQALIGRANEWLKANPSHCVRTCESIKSKLGGFKGGAVDTVSASYHQARLDYVYCRSLRMWVLPKGPSDSEEPQQIGYLNIVPECLRKAGGFGTYKFEEMDATVEKLNSHLRQDPLQGNVLNTETVEVKVEGWDANYNPDSTRWVERGRSKPNCYIYIMRLFYVVGSPAHEEIGFKDFIPEMVRQGGSYIADSDEPLANLASEANQWISQQQGIRVTNIQSINIKHNRFRWSGGKMNTMRTVYQENENTVVYVRFLRVCFVRSSDSDVSPLPQFSYRTFAPAQLKGGSSGLRPTFETQEENLSRVQAWLQHTGAHVLSAETIEIMAHWMRTRFGTNPDEVVTWDKPSGQHMVFVFRLVLDGTYTEPPAEDLPPVPECLEQPKPNNSCNIL